MGRTIGKHKQYSIWVLNNMELNLAITKKREDNMDFILGKPYAIPNGVVII